MSEQRGAAVVTGAGRGIGRAIALRLARDGFAAVVVDLDEATARETAADVQSAGGRALAFAADVADLAQMRAALDVAVRAFGAVDVWVNNAGWDKAEPFLENSEETWRKVVAVNLMGPIHGCRVALEHMTAEGKGRLINIASDAGRVGSTGEAVYSACKGGVIALTKSLAREVAKSGVTVNCVCPGPTDTPLLAGMAAYNPRLIAALERAIPLGRVGRPDDIAAAVAFFASDEAAYITGQTLSVSGGLTMA